MAAGERMKTTLADAIPPEEDRRVAVLCLTDPKTQRGITLDELFEFNEGRSRRQQRV